MSSIATEPIDLSAKGVFFLDLVAVELRKAFNTSAARWYSFSIMVLVALIDLIVTLSTLNTPLGGRMSTLLAINTGVLGFFLPIIPILLVTQEWGQRSALSTFTLEPRRHRVVLSKLAATVLIIALVNLVATLTAAAANILAFVLGAADSEWHITSAVLAKLIFGGLLSSLAGFAFAALLLNSPAAIVFYFLWSIVVPPASLALGFLLSWWLKVDPWIVLSSALAPLYSSLPMSTTDWLHVLVSTTLWIWLPLALGFWRIMRSEVK
jgi:ABC-2 type transport system permease protein